MAQSKGGGRRPASARRLVERLEIKGFKSIVDQTIELGVLNVVAGANGAGKTTLLEAIGMLGAAADGRVDDSELLRRGVRPSVPRLNKSAFADLKRVPESISLRAADGSGRYYSVRLGDPEDSVGASWRFETEELGRGTERIFFRNQRRASRASQSHEPERSRLDPCLGASRLPAASGSRSSGLSGFLDRVRSFALFDPQTTILRGAQTDLQQRHPLGLGGGGLASAVGMLTKSPLGKVLQRELAGLIEWTDGVSSGRSSWDLVPASVPMTSEVVCFADRFMLHGLERLAAYHASEGTLHVLFALAMVLHSDSPRFFAIEGFGHVLHPRLARDLTLRLGELAIEHERQIIVTTHNPLVLDSLPLEDDRVRLFMVARSAAGHTTIERVTQSRTLERAVESGGRWWAQGHGGIPSQ